MERLILLGVLLGAVISVTCDIDIGRGYHEEIGIPLAESIKAQEDAINVQDERIVGGAVASWNAHPYLVIFFIYYSSKIVNKILLVFDSQIQI